MVMPKRGDSRESSSGSSVEQEIDVLCVPIETIRIKRHTGSITLTTMLEYLMDQYHSRRKVYSRIGLAVPRKPKTERDTVAGFLNDMPW